MSDDDIMPEDDQDGDVGDDWAAAMAEQGVDEDTDAEADDWAAAMAEQDEIEEDVEAVAFENFDESGPGALSQDLDTILDIPVSISMEVGRTAITIRNLLQLNQGSVIELDRLAGEPLDVLVNGTLIAHGEVVVVNEKFGIRMTDVISPQERIKRLS